MDSSLGSKAWEPVTELGALLRKAREERGISLLEAEQATRIRRVFLQAIEEDRFDDLPGQVYGRGFVRSYATYLGLDPDEVLRAYPRAAAPEPMRSPEMLDEPLTPLAHRLTRWILILLLLGALAAGGWYLYDTYWVAQGWRVQSLWPPKIGPPNTALDDTTPQASPTEPAPTRTPTPSPTPEATEPAAGAETTLTPTATVTPTATPQPATPTPAATPTPSAGVAIEAVAQADTYLEIRADGELIWIGILRAEESAAWGAEEIMEMRVGNAGGLQLIVNGQDVGSLGASGEVINVSYRADELP
jgi:cytoskeleton protein RodZ